MPEPKLIEISFRGTTETVYAEKVDGKIYKCLESGLLIRYITYGCEIEVEETMGKLISSRIHKKSPFKTFSCIWSKEIVESDACKKMRDEIERIGGYWESAMGGVFIIHLLPEKINEIDRLLEMLKAE